MKVSLTKEQVAIIDNDDLELISKTSWCAQWIPKSSCYYAKRATIFKTIYMHCAIMEHHLNRKLEKWEQVDHINGNTLDNRKENLRLATRSQNLINRGKQKNNTSGYKGVSWHKEKSRWCARLKYRGKYLFLGYFDHKIEAAKMYDRASLYYWGDFAKLNFPEWRETYLSDLNTYIYNWMRIK